MWVVLRPIPTKREGDAHGSPFQRKILVKSPEPGYNAQKKGWLHKLLRDNYKEKLLQKIITGNYEWKLSASISITQKSWDLLGYWRIQKYGLGNGYNSARDLIFTGKCRKNVVLLCNVFLLIYFLVIFCCSWSICKCVTF